MYIIHYYQQKIMYLHIYDVFTSTGEDIKFKNNNNEYKNLNPYFEFGKPHIFKFKTSQSQMKTIENNTL